MELATEGRAFRYQGRAFKTGLCVGTSRDSHCDVYSLRGRACGLGVEFNALETLADSKRIRHQLSDSRCRNRMVWSRVGMRSTQWISTLR